MKKNPRPQRSTERLTDNQARARRMTAYYNDATQRLEARLAQNLRRRAGAIMERGR